MAEEGTTIWETLETEYPNAVFRDIAFFNATHGWVVGQWTGGSSGNGIILHTDDGGDTWQTQLQNGTEQKYDRIDILDLDSIWVTGYSSLYHTSDGGQSWNESNVVSQRSLMSTVEFIDENHGWTATGNVLYKTSNGGLTWTSVPGWTVGDNPITICFMSTTEVLAIGFRGIYYSEDGAETWSVVSDVGGRALSMLDNGEGWAVDDNALLHTVDGNTWDALSIPGRSPLPRINPPYLSDILFLDAGNGWIVGDEVPIMHTSDGGSSWYEQTVPDDVNNRLLALDFHNQTLGWVVGYDGAILRTNEGDALGPGLYSEFLNPIVLLIISISMGSVIVVSIVFIFRRRKRGTHATQNDIEPV